MARRLTNCLHQLDEKARTVPIMLGRLDEIARLLRVAAGVMKGITKERMTRRPDYNEQVLAGWAVKLQTLANELIIAQSQLAKHMSE
jgi:hypothetical protein